MGQTGLSGVHAVLSGLVNAYLIETPQGLVLIDTGFPKSEGKILKAVADLGHAPNDINHIVCTHAHPDHIGSLAALVAATGAQTWVHEADAAPTETGDIRPVHPIGGIKSRLMYAVAMMMSTIGGRIAGCRVDHGVTDGQMLPFGLQAIHAPGHCAGQIALMWPDRRLLLAADTCMNLRGIRPSLLNEDAALARQSLRAIAALDFDAALFGHGKPILQGAAQAFRDALN